MEKLSKKLLDKGYEVIQDSHNKYDPHNRTPDGWMHKPEYAQEVMVPGFLSRTNGEER